MTTHVLLANFGPKLVEVSVMQKGAQGQEPGMVAPDTVGDKKTLSSQQSVTQMLHDGQYIVVKEQP